MEREREARGQGGQGERKRKVEISQGRVWSCPGFLFVFLILNKLCGRLWKQRVYSKKIFWLHWNPWKVLKLRAFQACSVVSFSSLFNCERFKHVQLWAFQACSIVSVSASTNPRTLRSPMKSSDAETDFKSIIIIIGSYGDLTPHPYVTNGRPSWLYVRKSKCNSIW